MSHVLITVNIDELRKQSQQPLERPAAVACPSVGGSLLMRVLFGAYFFKKLEGNPSIDGDNLKRRLVNASTSTCQSQCNRYRISVKQCNMSQATLDPGLLKSAAPRASSESKANFLQALNASLRCQLSNGLDNLQNNFQLEVLVSQVDEKLDTFESKTQDLGQHLQELVGNSKRTDDPLSTAAHVVQEHIKEIAELRLSVSEVLSAADLKAALFAQSPTNVVGTAAPSNRNGSAISPTETSSNAVQKAFFDTRDELDAAQTVIAQLRSQLEQLESDKRRSSQQLLTVEAQLKQKDEQIALYRSQQQQGSNSNVDEESIAKRIAILSTQWLQENDGVELVNLRNKAFNNKQGKIVAFDHEVSRWSIAIPGAGGEQVILAKPSNLFRLASAPTTALSDLADRVRDVEAENDTLRESNESLKLKLREVARRYKAQKKENETSAQDSAAATSLLVAKSSALEAEVTSLRLQNTDLQAHLSEFEAAAPTSRDSPQQVGVHGSADSTANPTTAVHPTVADKDECDGDKPARPEEGNDSGSPLASDSPPAPSSMSSTSVQNTAEELREVQQALLQARQELASVTQQATMSDNPSTIQQLEQELSAARHEATEIAQMASSDVQRLTDECTAYTTQLEHREASEAELSRELQTLEHQLESLSQKEANSVLQNNGLVAEKFAQLWLVPGDLVELRELNSVAFNGRRGRLESWDETQLRWSVSLRSDSLDEEEESLLIKPGNLVRISDNTALQENSELVASVSALERQLDEKEQQQTELKSKLAEVVKRFREQKALLSEVQTRDEVNSEACASLREELTKAKNEVSEIQAENADELESYWEECNDLRDEVSAAEAAAARAAQTQRTAVQVAIKAARAELTQIHEQKLERALAQAVEEHEAQLANVEHRLEARQETSANESQELARVRSELEAMTQTASEHEEQVNHFKQKGSAVAKRYKEQVQTIKTLREQVSSLEQTLADREDRLASVQGDADSAEQQLQVYQRERAACQEKLDSAEKLTTASQNEIASRDAKIRELTALLENSKNDLQLHRGSNLTADDSSLAKWAPQWLSIGDDVELNGLHAAAYNGALGKLEYWDDKEQRWSVTLDDPESGTTSILIKPRNLRRVAATKGEDTNAASEISELQQALEFAVSELSEKSTEWTAEREQLQASLREVEDARHRQPVSDPKSTELARTCDSLRSELEDLQSCVQEDCEARAKLDHHLQQVQDELLAERESHKHATEELALAADGYEHKLQEAVEKQKHAQSIQRELESELQTSVEAAAAQEKQWLGELDDLRDKLDHEAEAATASLTQSMNYAQEQLEAATALCNTQESELSSKSMQLQEISEKHEATVAELQSTIEEHQRIIETLREQAAPHETDAHDNRPPQVG